MRVTKTQNYFQLRGKTRTETYHFHFNFQNSHQKTLLAMVGCESKIKLTWIEEEEEEVLK